jgi:hypothetical protein
MKAISQLAWIAAACAGPSWSYVDAGGHSVGFATIGVDDLRADATYLAGPELEGRDTPSIGLEAAAKYIEARLARAGAAPLDASAASMRWSFDRTLDEPVADACKLELAAAGAARSFTLGVDFVPIAGCEGDASGEIVFAGFGIESKSEHYDEIGDVRWKDKIALILEGEPRHAKRFQGPEVTREASLWEKISDLAEAGASGVIVARRPPAAPVKSLARSSPVSAPALGFRYTWASWDQHPDDDAPRRRVPAIEVSLDAGSALAGKDLAEVAATIDRTVRPARLATAGRKASFTSKTRRASVRADNVVARVEGTDLASEFVVVGAHYDHIGVDPRGRIGCGADDNASGTAALLEIAEAFATSKPRRSVILCAFAGEEDGLLGSEAFCARLPIGREHIVAMINLDMIGRGDPSSVAVIGVVQNPDFAKLLAEAKKLAPTGISEIVMRKGEELFERSDHYPFHKQKIPVLFFFEGLPIEKNRDYHTWRDTLDLLDYDKMLRTTRLVYNTAWLLANDDRRLPAPRD